MLLKLVAFGANATGTAEVPGMAGYFVVSKSIRQSLKNARDFETDGADKKDCDQDGDDHENDLMPRMRLKSERRPTCFAVFFHRKRKSHGLSA